MGARKVFVRMLHISGLQEYEEGKTINVVFDGDKFVFNNKQIVPLARVRGCEIGIETITLGGRPIAKALGTGFVSAIVGALLTRLTGYGGAMFFVFGIIGAIVGAISGVRPDTRNVASLSIHYQSLAGEDSVISVTENTKIPGRVIIEVADTVNNTVGYTPKGSTEQFKKKRYEI